MKKRQFQKKKCLFFLFVMLFIFVFCFWKENASFYREDFYQAVNEEVFSVDHLKDGEYTWSTFLELQEQADSKMNEVFSDVLEAGAFPQISVVYENALNMEMRNQEGLGVLSNYIDKINGVEDVSGLVAVISLLEKELGIAILSNIVVDSDYEDTNSNMVYLYPVSFPFGTSGDYYADLDYMTYKAYLKRAVIQILEVYGYDREEARGVSSELISFYEDVGGASKSLKELSDLESYFQKVTVSDLKKIYTEVSIEEYLKRQGLDGLEFYGLVDKGQYEKLNAYLDVSHLGLWKEHLLVMVLSYYANYLGEEYEQVVLKLNRAISGSKVEETQEERSRELVISLFSEEMDVFYEASVVTNEMREYLSGMFSDIQKVYKKMLLANEWLSEQTIDLAIDKLENMEFFIGLEGGRRDFSDLEEMRLVSFEEGGSFLLNVLEVIRVRKERELKSLSNHDSSRMVGESVVNAYYSPLDNAVYIPSATVFMVDMDASYYENLGKIGMVIAHEITHGFDVNGSRFDRDGNFENWWLVQDRENFDVLKEKVIDYYSSYEVMNGRYIDGDLTVNENIADLGAVRCIGLVADERQATGDEKKVMYSSFAALWASQSTDAYAKLLLLQDTHAPSSFRVNAVLSSMDDFYNLYDVFVWNKMYVEKAKRVQVW